MNEHEDLDALLKARFDREHQHVPADPFVANAMQKIRAGQRVRVGVRMGLYAAALIVAIVASPWLIAGAARLNAALASSLVWVAGLPGVWVVGVLAIGMLVVQRVRSR
jgi:hypothetical protein